MRRPGGLLLLLAAALAATQARASVPDAFGFGARSPALAGTGAATATGFDATWANPAGLTEAGRLRLTIGWVQGGSSLTLDGAARSVDATSGAIVGAAVPLPFTGALEDRVALGIGLFFPARLLNHALVPFPDQARLALLDSRTQVVSATGALAVKLLPRLSVGLGLMALATLGGEIALQPDPGGRIVSSVNERLEWSAAPLVGVRYRPLDDLRLALTFRGASRSGFNLRITNTLGPVLPIGVPTLLIAGTAQYDPLQLQAEGALRIADWLSASAGATFKRWSAFPLPTENVTPHTPAQPGTGFHDTVVPRAALEVTRSWGRQRLQGRVGYLFEMTPSPPDSPALVDADRHVLCAGGGLTLPVGDGALQIDLFAQWHGLAGSARASGRVLVGGLTVGIDL